MRYLIVGDTEGRLRGFLARQAASVSWHAVETDQLLRLEPNPTHGLAGWTARFPNHDEEGFAGVVLVSPPPQLPWLDPGLFDWESGRPGLVAGLLAPGLANLYVVGGRGSAFDIGEAELLLAMIRSQARLTHPLVDELMGLVAPSHDLPAGRARRRLERRVLRSLRPAGDAPWWDAARDLDGPLIAARST